MKKAARFGISASVSHARQILSVRRRLTFIRKPDRMLKEKNALLDAYKAAREVVKPLA
jgi:hypothetical protein